MCLTSVPESLKTGPVRISGLAKAEVIGSWKIHWNGKLSITKSWKPECMHAGNHRCDVMGSQARTPTWRLQYGMATSLERISSKRKECSRYSGNQLDCCWIGFKIWLKDKFNFQFFFNSSKIKIFESASSGVSVAKQIPQALMFKGDFVP